MVSLMLKRREAEARLGALHAIYHDLAQRGRAAALATDPGTSQRMARTVFLHFASENHSECLRGGLECLVGLPAPDISCAGLKEEEDLALAQLQRLLFLKEPWNKGLAVVVVGRLLEHIVDDGLSEGSHRKGIDSYPHWMERIVADWLTAVELSVSTPGVDGIGSRGGLAERRAAALALYSAGIKYLCHVRAPMFTSRPCNM